MSDFGWALAPTVVVHNGATTQGLTYLYIMNFTLPVTEGALAKI